MGQVYCCAQDSDQSAYGLAYMTDMEVADLPSTNHQHSRRSCAAGSSMRTARGIRSDIELPLSSMDQAAYQNAVGGIGLDI